MPVIYKKKTIQIVDLPRLKNFYGYHYYNLFFSQWINNFNRKTSIQRCGIYLQEQLRKDFSLLINVPFDEEESAES